MRVTDSTDTTEKEKRDKQDDTMYEYTRDKTRQAQAAQAAGVHVDRVGGEELLSNQV
jgi:hypothetical protein